MVLLIMMFIGWQTSNNLWMYLALGLAVLAKVSTLANQAKAVQAAQAQQQNQTQDLINNLFKSIQAKNN